MKNIFEKIFLNEKIIFAVILLNAVVIYLQVSGISTPLLTGLDLACTLIFLIEMIVKHTKLGVKEYWRSGWNRLDGILVIVSLPSLVEAFLPTGMMDLSILLIFRLLRVLRFFRVLHFFPNFSQIVKGFKMAMSESYAILLCFFVIIVIFGLLNCSLFKEIAPQYFSTPLESIYSVFRICTVEGWYDIPDTIATATTPAVGGFVRLYFVFILILGGIIGMSFINSIFVDAMVSDNNDDVMKKLEELEAKIDQLADKTSAEE
ncbi:MAG: ion transporter [Bacteroidales bacterium]|nr:ion transporter [Bacteroidales bacterium]